MLGRRSRDPIPAHSALARASSRDRTTRTRISMRTRNSDEFLTTSVGWVYGLRPLSRCQPGTAISLLFVCRCVAKRSSTSPPAKAGRSFAWSLAARAAPGVTRGHRHLHQTSHRPCNRFRPLP